MEGARTPGRLFAVSLAAITLIGPLAVHLFLPAMPAVKADFGVSESVAQLTLSATLFGMAFLTLAYGSLSDRYGRRPTLLWGMGLFLAGTVASLVAESIWLFVAGRFLQAVGAAAGTALSRAIARDVYGEDRLVKAIAYLTMAYTIGPMLAPPLGGALVDHFGWRAIFVVALAAGFVVTALAWFVLYETHRPRRVAAEAISVAAGYLRLFSSARFTGFVCQSGFSSGAFFSIAVSATYLMRETLHRSATEYGLFFLGMPLAFTCGTFLAGRLSGRVALETMVLAGSLVSATSVATQAAIVLSGRLDPLVIFIPGMVVTFSQGIALPNAQAGAIRIVPQLAGTAAGIGSFMSLFFAAVLTELVGVFADGTPVPMVALACGSAALMLVSGATPFALARRGAATSSPRSRRSG
jgi:MFS transporter, DHA1 family, multidrug resistance protein